MKNTDFKVLQVYEKDHAVFADEAKKKGFKFCVMFNRMCKKMFPKRYEAK